MPLVAKIMRDFDTDKLALGRRVNNVSHI
jgi:hypothetical protein